MAKLFTPEGYAELTSKQRDEITNGCGSKGIGGWLVPDTIIGLSVTPACDRHDFMYFIGKTIEDKQKADRTFLNNMIRIIEQDGKQWWWLVKWRKQRAYEYYLGVKNFGGSSFWDGKSQA